MVALCKRNFIVFGFLLKYHHNIAIICFEYYSNAQHNSYDLYIKCDSTFLNGISFPTSMRYFAKIFLSLSTPPYSVSSPPTPVHSTVVVWPAGLDARCHTAQLSVFDVDYRCLCLRAYRNTARELFIWLTGAGPKEPAPWRAPPCDYAQHCAE